MKKWIITILIIMGLTAFFYPKDRFFSCGPICISQEAVDKVDQEMTKTTCLGISGKEMLLHDASAKRCYGIFLKLN